MNKYHAIKTELDGIKFDSRAEARRYSELKLLEKAGQISDLELQPSFILQESFVKNGKKYQAIVYKADFRYKALREGGKIVVEDVKGVKTKEFRIKEKLFEKRYPDLSLRLI